MTLTQRRRLLWAAGLLAVLATVVGLVLYALSQNLNLFYTPTQIAHGEVPLQRTIRMGGLVVPGSVKRDPHNLKVRFVLTDNVSEVTVEYDGILPDLFREGQGIVALGQLNGPNDLMATQVLAKHDENYMPPEVAASLQAEKKQ